MHREFSIKSLYLGSRFQVELRLVTPDFGVWVILTKRHTQYTIFFYDWLSPVERVSLPRIMGWNPAKRRRQVGDGHCFLEEIDIPGYASRNEPRDRFLIWDPLEGTVGNPNLGHCGLMPRVERTCMAFYM